MNASVVQLARVESRRLVRNPLVWLVFLLSVQWLRGAVHDRDAEGTYNLLVGYGLVIPGLVILVHVVVAVLRARLSATEPLLVTLPVGPERRTVAHAGSAVAAAALAGAWTLTVLVLSRPSNPIGSDLVLRTRTDRVAEFIDVPRPNLAQLLQGPVALVAVLCLVVAVARWVPSWLVVIPMLFAAGSQLTFFGLWSGTPTGPADWLNPLARGWVHDGWVGCGTYDPLCDLVVSGFDQTTPWWHLAYLLSLAAWFVTIAVLRHRRDARIWWVFAATTASVVALAIVQCVVYQRFAPGSV